VRRNPHDIRAALAQLLVVLRAAGAIESDSAPESHLEREMACFDAHMRDGGGLALNTRQQRCAIVARFLAGVFRTGPILVPGIELAAIRQFVLGNGAGWSAGTVSVTGGAIGGYLRFRAFAGDRVTALLAAIPRAAHWRLASLPEVLTDAEVDELLRSFDPPFRSHRRAFAMLRCLTDLGLIGCPESVRLDYTVSVASGGSTRA
jgi:hypothetical protein